MQIENLFLNMVIFVAIWMIGCYMYEYFLVSYFNKPYFIMLYGCVVYVIATSISDYFTK